MVDLWKVAFGLAGIGAVAAFVFWSLYREWLKLPIFQRMTKTHQYRLFNLLIVLVFLFCLAGLIAYVFVVKKEFFPRVKDRNNIADSNAKFEVFFHERRLDLSDWQFVPDGRTTEKLSAAVWTDKLKVRRLKDYAKSLCIRHATTGVPTPEFSSDHLWTVNETTELPQGGPRPKLRIFDVCLDVSGEPVEQWFELRLISKYWNAFNNPQTAWAAIPIVNPTNSAVFEVVFPKGKPVKTWERREGSRDTTTSELITDDAIQISDDRRILRWRLDRPQLNWVYKFVWEW